MARGSRRGTGTARAQQSRPASATGARATNNASAAPQPPPPADQASAPTPPSWPSLSSALQDALRVISSAASDKDADQRYRQPKDAELQEVKRALQWLHDQLPSPADDLDAAPVPQPSAAAAPASGISRLDYELLLARFAGLEAAVRQSANPPPPAPLTNNDSAINRRNPPPGTRAAAASAHAHAQRLQHGPARPRVRHRVVLNLRGLPPHHPARTKSAPQLLISLKDLIFRAESISPVSVEKLRSGDIGINFANQAEVEQMLASEGEGWIAEAFPDQEQLPVLRLPTFNQLQTIVVHGMPFADGDGEQLAAALTTANNNITFTNSRFLASPARRAKHPDGFGSVLVLCEDPGAKARALDRGQLGYKNQSRTVAEYRAALRLQQCGHCQQFGHVARHCRRSPVCRLCAGKHPTTNHPPCTPCKDSNFSSCAQHSLKCANCAEAHKADDELCEHQLAWRDALANNDVYAYAPPSNLPSDSANSARRQDPRTSHQVRHDMQHLYQTF